uniref:Uncharacterized protein n=1 Tax=Anopheles minimus TaxID=112268 RepID=A0A182WGE6_9DIPT
MFGLLEAQQAQNIEENYCLWHIFNNLSTYISVPLSNCQQTEQKKYKRLPSPGRKEAQPSH